MVCPKCQQPIQIERASIGRSEMRAYECRCGHKAILSPEVPMSPQTSTILQLKLPGVEQGRAQNKVYQREAQVQTQTIGALTARGYLVLETSEHRKGQPCPSCGHWFRTHVGRRCSKGIPDLLVTHLEWPLPVFLGIEVKGSKTAISPEQKQLAAQGRIVIIRSVEEALAAVARFDGMLRKRARSAA